MKSPALVLTNRIGGEPSAWKCPLCSEPFDLSPFQGTTDQKVSQMIAAYEQHLRERHAEKES